MGQLGGPVDEDYGATAGGSMMSVSNSFMQYGGAEGSELGPGYTGPTAEFSSNPFAGTVVQESGGAATSSQEGSRQAASSAPAPQPTGGGSTAAVNGVAGVRRPVERVPPPDIKVPPPSGDRAQLYITVTQPKPQIGPGKFPGLTEPYISYQVATETRLENSSGQQLVVWRRFKDFVALDELLRLTHRGMFIPPRPEKLVLRMGKNSDPVFVEKRRMALQAYLNRLASHHALSCSEELRVFLEEPGELRQSIAWQQLQPLQATWVDGTVRLLRQAVGQEGKVPAPSEAARPADQSADILRKIKEVMARRQGESGMASTGSLDTPSLDDEALLRQKKCVLRDMAMDFKKSSLAARQVVIAGQGVSEELAGLSAAAQELARLEERYQHVSPRHLDTAAACLGGLARVTMRKAMESSNMLVGLHGYARLMPCVLQALEQREEALVTVQVLEADMAKCSQAGRQQGAAGQGATVRKAQQLTRDRAALEAAKQAGLSEYTRVMSRNLDELRWMESDQLLELGRVLIGFAVEQKTLADESFLAWVNLAEDIGANRSRIAKLRASFQAGGSSS